MKHFIRAYHEEAYKGTVKKFVKEYRKEMHKEIP
jgi:hypothetical protein